MEKGTLAICAMALSAVMISGCNCMTDEERLNEQAAKEYLIPVRPFTEGRNPCWNEFCPRFIYAPVFDFAEVEGAQKYRFTLTEATDGEPGPEAASWSFEAESPAAALSPVWNDIPVGSIDLKVEGIDKDGNVKGTAGERRFFRDFPFEAPYPSNIRPYKEAALMGMLYIHNKRQIKHWAESVEPDMSYSLNTYANKIIGNTVSVESKLASFFPEYAEEAIKIAKNAAQFLIDQSRPEGEVLAYFPPTYYGGLIASSREENIGKVMTMDPCYAANGFLDLYDATGEQIYRDRATGIADTYNRIQAEDGSFPIKLDLETGEPVNGSKAMLHPLLNFIRRLENQYGIHDYDSMRDKAEKWMSDVAIETFDLTGQFEDVSVEMEPYQNLTNCTAATYASYLLKGENISEKDLQDAIDLIRLSEDQFVHWNTLPGENGVRRTFGPCVYEQLQFQTPVDNSTCNVANALLDLYNVTGDKLAYAKAKALVDALTIAQDIVNGQIPTILNYKEPKTSEGKSFWLNCSATSINMLLRMAEMTGEE